MADTLNGYLALAPDQQRPVGTALAVYARGPGWVPCPAELIGRTLRFEHSYRPVDPGTPVEVRCYRADHYAAAERHAAALRSYGYARAEAVLAEDEAITALWQDLGGEGGAA